MDINRKILIVDDDENIQDDYRQILKKTRDSSGSKDIKDFTNIHENIASEYEISFDLDFALNINQAEELVKRSIKNSNRYSVAFIDLNLEKENDGLKCADLINEIDEDIEIILVTAYNSFSSKLVNNNKGYLYLKKPFASEEIEQLALNLSYKYSLKIKNKIYSENLKQLISIIRKIKGRVYDDIYSLLNNILIKIIDFTKSEKGIIFFDNENENIEIVANKTEESLEKLYNHLNFEKIVKFVGNHDNNFIYFDKYFIMVLKPSDLPAKNYYILLEDSKRDFTKNKKVLIILIETLQDLVSTFFIQQKYIKKQKLASVGKGIYKIISDLEIPINNINEYLNVIQDKIDKKNIEKSIKNKFKKYLTKVDKTSSFIIKSLDSISNFTKKDIKYNMEKNSIKKAIKEVYSEIKIVYDNKGIKLDYDIQDDIKFKFDGDKIKRAVRNILSNAKQALVHCEQKVKYANIKCFKEEDFYNIEILNNGPKIPEDIQENIFEVFKTKGAHKGTGIGMAITKKIIEKHNGIIDFDTNDERTIFYIKLPIK